MVGCRHDWSMLTFVHLVEHVTVLNNGKVTDCKGKDGEGIMLYSTQCMYDCWALRRRSG